MPQREWGQRRLKDSQTSARILEGKGGQPELSEEKCKARQDEKEPKEASSRLAYLKEKLFILSNWVGL